jgi:ferredoxin-NADP reductase
MHTTQLIDRRTVAESTIAIRLERPEGFEFSAGQYIDVFIRELPFRDELGPVRSLTIASAPSADHIELVMRVRDTAFKQAMMELEPGSEIVFEGPFDDLAFDPEPGRELVFLAAGVGITPFLSVLREARQKGEELPATLFYSNACPEYAVALDELERYQEEIPGFRLVATMTRPEESAHEWKGETGRISLDFLERHLPSIVGPAYYLAGTTPFVSELMNALIESGVEIDDIGVEVFTGY